jgi:competence protein ComEC
MDWRCRLRAGGPAAVGALAGAVRDPARAAALRARASAALRGWIAEDIAERRLFLWLPACFGVGVLLYFSADRAPSLWAPLAAATSLGAGARAALRRDALGAFRICLALAVLFAGFAASVARTRLVAAPIVGRMQVATTTGYVESVDDHRAGKRLLLRVAAIEGVAPADRPERIRVTARNAEGVRAGATITAKMRLLPPSRPSEPGGYDFARAAFFQRVGAVGNVVSRIEPAPDAAVSWVARFNAWVDRGRNDLTHRIAGVIGGADGAVAAALVTGKRGLIPEQANDALRAAGIYHVVSISGLHMVLAAGLFLWSLRAVLALFPAVALRHPIKKWAATFAIVGVVAYDIFAGSEVATERSLVMILVILAAVLLDRPALSMRNLAMAALIILALEPEQLLGPSFQMSFAAVAAMIAAFERRPGFEVRDGPPPPRVRTVVGAALLTTLVAGLATDPYSSFHFHRISLYGIVGNTLTLPLVEFLVMPAAALGVAAGPFGLDAPVWTVMGWGISGMMAVAHWVAGLASATRQFPAFGGGALLAMTLALLWLTIWTTPIRWVGLGFAAFGLALAATTPRPDVIIDAQGRALAARNAKGGLDVLNAKGNFFAVQQWLAADADPRGARDHGLIGAGRCDADGCVARLPDGRAVALARDKRALAEDCARAAVVVTHLPAADLCKGPDLVLDAGHFRAHGATQIYAARQGAGWRLVTSRRETDNRPWSPAPAPPRTRPSNLSPDPEAPDSDAPVNSGE